MECKKCGSLISGDSKFCGNCGAEIKKDLNNSLSETVDICSKVWFMVGFIRGSFSRNKKDMKGLEEFEDHLKNGHPGMWDDYKRVFNYMVDFVNENHGKSKETIRSKRKSIPDVKTVQKE
ncbi:MAG: zinc ribbon domain-containing protein [Nanoarchaeota archaeon]